MVRNYQDHELLERVKFLPTFKGFPKGVLDIWVRSKADTFNQFDDKCYTFECYGDARPPRFIMVTTGTTNAGAYGLQFFAKWNPLGCAILAGDMIVYESHAAGLHKGKPAYKQIKGFPYYRDNNKNDRCEEIGKVYSDVIGANCHRAGWFSKYIANWSVACLVRNQLSQFTKWLEFMNGRKLTVAILNEF